MVLLGVLHYNTTPTFFGGSKDCLFMDGHNWISTGEPEPEFDMLSLGLTDVLYLQMKVGEADFLPPDRLEPVC